MSIKKPSETDLVKACLELLKLRGVMAWRNNTGSAMRGGRQIRFGYKGSSDIIGIMPLNSSMPGSFLAVECKTDKGKLRREQKLFLEAIREAGGYAVVTSDVRVLDMLLRPRLQPSQT